MITSLKRQFTLCAMVGLVTLPACGGSELKSTAVDQTGAPAAVASSSQPQPMIAHTDQAKGAAILMPFKKQLKGALMAGMQQGPEQAVAACNEQAPGIAQTLKVDGITVGRSSHKLRNPGNAAQEWLAPIIEEYVAGIDLGARVVELEDGLTAYVEPIKMQPMCTACHGDNLAPDIAQRIHALYPQDEATGFKAGDFRGVFWTTF